MLIPTCTELVLRCGLCQSVVTQEISAFMFQDHPSLPIFCDCGFRVGEVKRQEDGLYELKVACIACGKSHQYQFSYQDFFGTVLHPVLCKRSESTLAYLGPKELQPVQEAEDPCLNSWVNEHGYDDFFDDPQIMMGILNRLYDMTRNKGIYCCCGNKKIAIKIYPDRIFFSCPECKRTFWLLAESRGDIEEVEQMKEIVLK